MRRNTPRLMVNLCTLEERAVPANDLTIVDNLTASVNVDAQQQGTTVTFRTTDAGALLSVADIRTELLKPNVNTVVISTEVDGGGTDGLEDGSILWVDEVLDLSGIGAGKTLRLATDAGATMGNITLDGVFLGGFGSDTLAFEVDSSGPGGSVDFLASSFFPVNLTLPGAGSVMVNAGTGNFTYQPGVFVGLISTGGPISITANNIDLGSQTYESKGNITLSGAIDMGGATLSSGGNITLGGAVTLAGVNNVLLSGANSTTTFASTVDGAGDLTLDGATTFTDNVGATTALNSLTIQGGELTHGTNTVESASITVGAGFLVANSPAILGNGTGLITTLNLTVNTFGAINPGGVGTVGVANIDGAVAFNGGSYSPDLGGTSDVLNVIGDVDVSFGTLGGGIGTGTLPPAGSATVLTYTGNLLGEFLNAPEDAPAIAGADAIFIEDYAPAIVLKPVVASNLPGADLDGTGYTVKLTGGGELVTFQDPLSFFPSVVVRNATPKSALAVTTVANSSDEFVMFNEIVVNGPLASFKGPKVNVFTSFRTTGKLGAATLGTLMGALESGGAATDKLALTMLASNGGSIKTGSTISALKVAGNADVNIKASGVTAFDAVDFTGNLLSSGPLGKVKFKGTVFGMLAGTTLGSFDAVNMFGTLEIAGPVTTIKVGTMGGLSTVGSLGSLKAKTMNGFIDSTGALGPIAVEGNMGGGFNASSVSTVKAGGIVSGNWNVSNGIKSLAAGSVQGLNVTAQFLETLTVLANKKLNTDGGILGSTFLLSGNNGGAGGSNALKTATISGTIDGTVFTILGGNVGAFTTGRFINSFLHVNYTPDISFDIAGTFGGPQFGIGTFKTTAATLGNVNHPYNWSFAGSEVAAAKIGTVDLSGVNTTNFGNAFGIKYDQGNPTIKVKTASNIAVPLAPTTITASGTAIADDFFVIDL